jgi:uncharacterized membrane protein
LNNEESQISEPSKRVSPRLVLILSIIGIFSALICVLTMVISIPIPATQGFINIGDAGVMICGLLFGPIIGGFSGGIGSALADLFLGYVIYAPGTLVIKGLEGFLVGIIASPKKHYKKLNYRDIIGVLIGGLVMVFGYFFYEIIIYGIPAALFEFFLNAIFQLGLGALIALIFTGIARKPIIDNLPQVFDKLNS